MQVQERQAVAKPWRNRKAWVAAAAAGLGAAGAFVLSALIATPGPPPSALFTTNDDGNVALIDTQTGEWVYEVPNAQLAPDRSVIYQTTAVGSATEVTALDPVNAEQQWRTTLPGRLEIRVVSPEGKAVALMAPRTTKGLYTPEPRQTTEITVARTDGTASRRYGLNGNYEPEAFSRDGGTLFLLEFLPAENPSYYEVARLDLEFGELIDTVSLEVHIEPPMRGHARDQVMAPNGSHLYTLYSLDPGEEPLHDHHHDPRIKHHAFVHAINLEAETSACIFLPSFIGSGKVDELALAVSPDGSNLAVVDMGIGARSGMLAEIDPTLNEVVRFSAIAQHLPQPGAVATMAIGAEDTAYVGWGGFVAAYEPAERIAASHWNAPGTVQSMDVSEDGKFLRAVVPGHIYVVDLASGIEATVIALPDQANRVVSGPPAIRNRFEAFTCAC